MRKKTILALSLYSIFAIANPEPRFTAIIEVENAVAQKVGVVEKNITAWQNVGSEYDCTSWSPNVNTIDLGIVFEQSQDCSQDQSRTKDIYSVYNTGSEVYEKTETEYKTITETNKQNAVGTKNFKDTERADPWGEWIDNAGHYNCDTWTPATSTINYGDSFSQTRNCSQNQDRTRDVYDVWADGTETYNRTETESQTIIEKESQSAIGTKNYISSTRNDTWTNWIDTGTHYDCGSWSPNPNTIDYGDSFTQTRNCSQDQTRSRDVYDVWADGTETLNTVEVENKTISEQESQSAIGTKNYKDTERADSWSSWSNTGGHYNCGTWTPATSTINYGDSFTQKRDCDQNQIRSRDVYDVWADGSETFNRTETETKVIDVEESQSATGTKNYVVSTSTSTGSWSNSGGHYNCSSWTPPQSNYYTDQRFTQKRTCSQNQVATETTYNNWADGTQTVKTTSQKSKVVSEEESRQVYGTKSRKNWTLYQQSAMIYYEQYNAGSTFTQNGYDYNKTTSQPSGSCNSSTGLYYRRHNGVNYNMYYVDLYRCQ